MNILFVGLGNLGAQVFDLFLMRATRDQRFLVAGRDLDYLRQRAGLTAYAASQLGVRADVSCAFMDVQNVEQTAQTIAAFKPDVIFSSVTVQPSSAISKLPRPVYEQLAPAKSGPWLPLTLVLVYKLMQAVRQTGLTIPVLNGAAPDNAHAVLGHVRLAPMTGVGNLANAIPALREAIASQLQVDDEHLEVLFVGHNQVFHGIRVHGDPGEAPYHLAALLNDNDITNQLDKPAIFRHVGRTMKHEYTQLLSAASAAAVFDAIMGRRSQIVHGPGPNGLPGAYPFRAVAGGVEVVLPKGLTLDEAITICQAGQRLDGIEYIDEAGTVYFAEKNMSILKKAFDYDCRTMPLSEVEQWSQELHAKYLAFAKHSA